MTSVIPTDSSSPAHGLSSNARPPSRPMKNEYPAQTTAATAVAGTNRRCG
jgi:hypothetical protein